MNPSSRTSVLAAALVCGLCLVSACGSDAAGQRSPSTTSSSRTAQDGINGGSVGPGGPGAKPGGRDKGGPPPGHDATVPPEAQDGETGSK